MWQDEMITILRVLINDTSEDSPTNSDESLEQALVVAARQVLGEASFTQDFAADVVNIDIAPDPADDEAGTRDNNFIDLTCLKAACIIDRGSSVTAARQAIRIKDGSSEVDLRMVFQAKLALLKQGWCAVYADRLREFITGQQGLGVGAAILGPFRLEAGGSGDRPFYTNYDPRWSR